MAEQNGSKKRTAWILIGAMAGILLASLDSNIVSTAMPKIIGSLNGTAYYTWPVTAYLLAMTISMPLVGKLSDVYGYKPIYFFGIVVFLAGSVLCGVSQSMAQFIAFRGLQGIGGAVLISNTMAIIGILVFAFPASHAAENGGKIDFAGAAVLIAALVPMLLAFSWGGEKYSWNSAPIIGMLAFAAVMIAVFGRIERKAGDPIIPMSLFQNSVFNFSAMEMFLFNGVMMACIIFVPLFLQEVKGLSPSSSGAVITPMMVSLIAGVMISGMVISRTCRYKLLAAVGFLVMGAGTVILTLLNGGSDDPVIVAAMVIMGLGIGIAMAIFNVTAQNVFPNSRMGVVTSSIQFFRMMGQTVASSVLGTIFSSSLSKGIRTLNVRAFPPQVAHRLTDGSSIADSASVSAMKAMVPAGLLPDFEALLSQARQVLSGSIHLVFVICAAVTLVSLLLVLFLKEVPMSRQSEAESPEN